ncbi:MAG: CheX protein [Caulobacter sp.]|nr:CheX protein [Caulobacter sp.]
MTEPLILESVLDLKAAAALKTALLERRGQPLSVDASGVQRLGALCLQILMAARHTWADDTNPLAITPRSDAFNESVRLFGANAHLADVMLEGAA